MLIDTHCHLDFPEFDHDRDEALRRAKENGVGYIVNIGSSLEGSRRSVELAGRHDCIYAVVGVHPHEADAFDEHMGNSLRELSGGNKVVAIGETGLDYYRNYSKAENQKKLFAFLISLAQQRGLPLVIHNREAHKDTLEMLQRSMPPKAVIHCFAGDDAFLKECLELGFYISFTCNITYKKAEALRALVQAAPLERLMLETDAPYLSPEGLRGTRNEPSYVRHVAEEISRIKGISVEEVAALTTENAKRFFNLK